MTSLYDYTGDEEALRRLEAVRYDNVLADPPPHVQHPTLFTAESFGEPDRFTDLGGVEHRLLAFQRRYEWTAAGYGWRFTISDLDRLLRR